MRPRPLVSIVVLCLLAPPLARAEVPANPADQPPFGGGEAYQLTTPPPGAKSPPGFRLNTETVTATASEAVSGMLDSHPYSVRVRIRLGSAGQRQWQVDFLEPGGEDIAQVVIDDRSGD